MHACPEQPSVSGFVCECFIGGCVRLQDLVTVIVSFNRALYAQLAQQQFQPPRGYPLPAPNNPTFKAANLGMKLTCGFEMVMAKYTSGIEYLSLMSIIVCPTLTLSSHRSWTCHCQHAGGVSHKA